MYRVSFQADATSDHLRVRLSSLRHTQASPVPTTMEPSSELIEGGIYVALTATKPASEGIKEKKLSWKIAVATSGQTAFVYGVAPCDRSKPGSSNKWSMTNAAEVNIIDISGLCVLYRIGSLPYTKSTRAGLAGVQAILSKCQTHEQPCPISKAPIRLGVDWAWVKNGIVSLACQGYVPNGNAAIHYWSEPCVRLALANWDSVVGGESGKHKIFDESA